jgi:thiosulfate/3-mercaptopyruvate sulfurtransferase
MKRMRTYFQLFFFSLLAFTVGCSRTGDDVVVNPGLRASVLISAADLAQQLNNPNYQIIDIAQIPEEYAEGHIAGALFVDWRMDITDPAVPDLFNLPPQAMYEGLMDRLGVTPDTTVVLYDNFNSRFATRVFWTMRYYGHNTIKILDGGRGAWLAAGFDISTEAPVVEPSDYRVSTINAELLAEMPFIKSQLTADGFKLLDGRPHAQYTGEAPGKVYHTGTEHAARGHIYGAQNVPWSTNFNEDGTFKSNQELLELYTPHGLTPDKTIVTYCNEGLHASPPWFVMHELLGYADVKLYDSSMGEWANQAEPNLILGEHCM